MIATQQKDPVSEKWLSADTEVLAGSQLKVQGNTSLRSSLMGTELVAADKVTLELVSKSLNKDGNTVVICAFDYSNSPLKFEF